MASHLKTIRNFSLKPRKNNLMKFKFSALLVALVFASSLIAQVIDHPIENLSFKINQSGGSNGTGVAFNPKTKLYYTFFAGNEAFPLEVFGENGRTVYKTKTGVDTRGVWFNKKTNSIEVNAYSTAGILRLKLDESGNPSLGATTVFSGGSHQPQSNACGTFDGKKLIYYFYDGKIYTYSRKSGEKVDEKSLEVFGSMSKINRTSIIYTGKKKMEIGLLDHVAKKVYLINKKTMQISKTIYLPDNAPVEDAFNFAYANNHVFLFNQNARKWVGYKIFEK